MGDLPSAGIKDAFHALLDGKQDQPGLPDWLAALPRRSPGWELTGINGVSQKQSAEPIPGFPETGFDWLQQGVCAKFTGLSGAYYLINVVNTDIPARDRIEFNIVMPGFRLHWSVDMVRAGLSSIQVRSGFGTFTDSRGMELAERFFRIRGLNPKGPLAVANLFEALRHDFPGDWLRMYGVVNCEGGAENWDRIISVGVGTVQNRRDGLTQISFSAPTEVLRRLIRQSDVPPLREWIVST